MSSRFRASALVLGIFFSGALGGAVAGTAVSDDQGFDDLDLLARVLTTIESDFVEERSTDELVQAALRGMVDNLDEHSQWLSEDEYRALRDRSRGSYQGIGVEVRRIPEGVLVGRVLPGSPAREQGVTRGDKILAIDGQSIEGWDLPQVSGVLRGQEGEPVELELLRQGMDAPQHVSVVRGRVETPPVDEVARLPDDVGYVRLSRFKRHAARELKTSIEGLLEEAPLAGLILDLRDNTGGLLDESVAVADLFLSEGPLVVTRGRGGERTHPATAEGLPDDLPVVVLINGLSASGSEIVAGALQDTGRAILVGSPTYGKGSVQQLVTVRDRDQAMKLTVSRFYTPSGKPVADRDGRHPDHLVEHLAVSPRKELEAEIEALPVEDATQARLLGLLAQLPDDAPREAPVPWDTPLPDRLHADPQLEQAFELLSTQQVPWAADR